MEDEPGDEETWDKGSGVLEPTSFWQGFADDPPSPQVLSAHFFTQYFLETG